MTERERERENGCLLADEETREREREVKDLKAWRFGNC
jgi:hypothetical protein